MKSKKNLYRWRVLIYQADRNLTWGSVADRITHEDAQDLAAMLNRKRTPLMMQHGVSFKASEAGDPACLYLQRSSILDAVQHLLENGRY